MSAPPTNAVDAMLGAVKPLPAPVLVIDDDENLRALVKAVGADQDVEVVEARDGETALELFSGECESSGKRYPFAVVFLDLRLPGMSGDAVLAKILELRPNQPVIVVSGYLQDFPSLVEGHPTGFVGLVQKPFLPEDIKKALTIHRRAWRSATPPPHV